MPQLDLAGFPSQIIWLVITFVILWLLMAKIALPRVGLVLEERQKKIDENLDLAENLRDEAQGALDAYEKSIAEAKDNARSSVTEAVRQMSDSAQARHAEKGEELAAEIKEAEARIDEAKQEAISGIQEAAATVASSAAEKLIGASLPSDAVRQAVNTAMKERST